MRHSTCTKVWGICFYYGEPATSLDHCIIPYSYGGKTVVKACRECNNLLSAKTFDTMYHRVQYLKDSLKKRYKQILDTPEWSPIELKGLNVGLRKLVVNNLRKKKEVIRRLAFEVQGVDLAYGSQNKHMWAEVVNKEIYESSL